MQFRQCALNDGSFESRASNLGSEAEIYIRENLFMFQNIQKHLKWFEKRLKGIVMFGLFKTLKSLQKTKNDGKP